LNLVNWLPRSIPVIWAVGMAVLIVRFAAGLLFLRRMRKRSTFLDYGNLHPTVRATLIQAGGHRRIALFQNGTIGPPVTWGLMRPVIILPARLDLFSAGRINAALLHELAHIRRYDFLVRLMAELAEALVWFQPLMWITSRRLREEQELACDNWV